MPQVERDEIVFKEPILEQKDVKVKVSFAEPCEWKPKEPVKSQEGIKESYKAVKITLTLTDIDSVRTEHADAIPKTIIEDQFNVEKYPFMSKKTGELSWMNRGKLFNIEEAFGFDPVYVDKDGNEVEPHVTRNGAKIAPKLEGVARILNPNFVSAYFHEDMTVNPTNWIGKELLVDVEVEKSEQFGDKNTITRYKKLGF